MCVCVDVGLMVATMLHKNKYLSPEQKQNINNVKRKRELAELLFIDVKEGFIQKVDLGYTLVSPIIKLRLHISLSYN